MTTFLSALLLAIDGGQPDAGTADGGAHGAGTRGLVFDGGSPPVGEYWVIRQRGSMRGSGSSGYGGDAR